MSNDLLGLNLIGPPDTGPSAVERDLIAGFAGALAALAVSAGCWLGLGAPFLPLRVADALFAVMPISIVELGVTFLGPWAKRFAFAGCVAGYTVILGYLSLLLFRWRRHPRLGDGVLFGVSTWAVASLTIVPIVGGGVFGVAWGQPWVLSPFTFIASAVAYGAVAVIARRTLESNDEFARRGATIVSRRTFFGGIVAAGVAVLVVEGVRTLAETFGWGSTARVSGGSGTFPDIDGLSREVTPTADFYHVSKNVFDPEGVRSDWRLEVVGLVARPRDYTLAELQTLPAAEGFATLACISNLVGGDLIGNAYWKGVPLAAILSDATVSTSAVDVVFTALDGYTDSIPIDRALQPGSLLAYEMNGAALNGIHGAPLRLIVPGIFGMKNVKWITRLEIVATDYKGYWQSRGWDDRAEYQTMSRIDVAPSGRVGDVLTIAGIAFAGDRGVSLVEVSTDAGRTWSSAELRPPLSLNSWVLWHLSWSPVTAGAQTIVVRATDGLGVVQSKHEAPPIPSGATGWHAVDVTIRPAAP